MRRILVGIAVLAGVGAVLLAFLPFNFVRAEDDLSIAIHCKPPIVSAWSRGEKRLALWATTLEDGTHGATVRSGEGPFCGENAHDDWGWSCWEGSTFGPAASRRAASAGPRRSSPTDADIPRSPK
jgi:hypothetical protein